MMDDVERAQQHFRAGETFASRGAFAQALAEFALASELMPASPEAASNAGAACLALGRPEDAIPYLQRALMLAPQHGDAHQNLATALLALERYDQARVHYERAMQFSPADPAPANSLGLMLLARAEHDAAAAAFRAAIERAPGAADLHTNLGYALHGAGAIEASAAALLHAVELAPEYPRALAGAGNLLWLLERYDQAVPLLERAVAIDPADAKSWNVLGLVLHRLGRGAEAVSAFERAVAADPALADAHYNLGVISLYLGAIPRAQAAFASALELVPGNVKYYDGWFNTHTAGVADESRIARLQALLDNEPLTDEARIQAHFTLAKVCEDLARYGEAFEHLIAGSAAKRALVTYDEARELGLMQRIAATFTSQRMRALAGGGNPSDTPVFIVGMPRSGTTLVEQILASHPSVQALGERNDLALELIAYSHKRGLPQYPELLECIERGDLAQIGSGYLLRVGEYEKPRVTDKMLANFLTLGLIALALPHAKIVHVRRDPVDTCLSCFAQLFTFGNLYTYDLAELARYYRGYEALMEHWRSVLPPGMMLEVQYEQVAADLEVQARRLIAHVGLPWDERCLTFYSSQRVVDTASAAQVRRPVYTTSVGRHRRYGDRLRPLLDVLDPEN